MCLQNLKLLCPTVKEEMYLQEIFHLTLTQGQGHIKHCHLHHLKLLRPMVKEMNYKESTLFDLDPQGKGVKVTGNVAQYPRFYVTYAPAKFDVATFHG